MTQPAAPNGFMSGDVANQKARDQAEQQNRAQDEADRINGFHVVPRQLVLMSRELGRAAETIDTTRIAIQNTGLTATSLGLLGTLATYEGKEIPEAYTSLINDFGGHISRMAEALHTTCDQLKKVADHYAAQDNEYYRAFGKIDERASDRLDGPGRVTVPGQWTEDDDIRNQQSGINY